MTHKRTEYDKIGSIELDCGCVWGIHTERALNNFKISGACTDAELIKAVITVKNAAAMANRDVGLLEEKAANAIITACGMLLTDFRQEYFPVDALSGGAGTSINMNVNEVLANLALKELGYDFGRYDIVNPFDHVNKGQSTNDVYPTALRIAAIDGIRMLSDECARLQEDLQEKELEFSKIKKIGRTQLMDAVEISLGEEFGAYAQAISRDRWRIYKAEERLRYINIGGTAVGTGVLAEKKFVFLITEYLRTLTGFGLARAEYPMDITQNNDIFVEVSGLLKALAVNLIKICSDLRLMNSEPYSEIKLKPYQAGSSIMPGKVNPVIPEAVTQAAIGVVSNDTAITLCAQMGSFELNAFTPLIAHKLLESIRFLINAVQLMREKCIKTLSANEEGCRLNLDKSTAYGVELAREYGYEKATEMMRANESKRKQQDKFK